MAKIIIKKCNSEIEILDIPSSKAFDRMRTLIGGEKKAYIECVHLEDPPYSFSMYVDEDGIAKKLPVNFKIETMNPLFPVQDILGTVCFARGRIVEDDVEYIDVTEQDKKTVLNLIERGKIYD